MFTCVLYSWPVSIFSVILRSSEFSADLLTGVANFQLLRVSCCAVALLLERSCSQQVYRHLFLDVVKYAFQSLLCNRCSR